MKQTVYRSTFIDAFQAARPDNFTYAGLCALFDYLEEYEESTGQEIELDVVALCCEFTEFASFEEFCNSYSDEWETIEDLQESATVIMIDDESFIIQDF